MERLLEWIMADAPDNLRAHLLEKARALPDAPGVYIMKDEAGAEIYVGKSKNLKKRVTTYFHGRDETPKTVALVENIHDFDYVETDSEIEALLYESRLIKDLKPKYNMMLKDMDRYPYIEVTMGEDFPRVLVKWRKIENKSRWFGPFVSGGDVRATLNLLQRIFRYRMCSRQLQAGSKPRRDQRACLNYHIGRCAGACCGRIGKEEYRKRIASLCRFLAGQKKDLIKDLNEEMRAAAGKLQFESAAALRDLVQSLESIHEQPALDAQLAPAAPSIDLTRGLEALQEALRLPQPPRCIEGIDIANLQGQETVGSLVSFRDGLPFKDGYRRFRIETVEGQDDFASIREVVNRRYGRLAREGKPLPDIVLIDGGKGQLAMAAKALGDIGAKPGALLALVKKEETLYREGEAEPVPLSKRSAGLKLLMYVRDEAHRFAQHYHHILRRKTMFGEKK